MGRTRSARPPAAKNDRLDLIDRKILSALMKDGRLTNSELAAKVGLSASSCWTRVKRLEAEGAIERYVAIISQAAKEGDVLAGKVAAVTHADGHLTSWSLHVGAGA